MNGFVSSSSEENLSEDILSENASTGEIKTSMRLTENMGKSSFSKKEISSFNDDFGRPISHPMSLKKSQILEKEGTRRNSCIAKDGSHLSLETNKEEEEKLSCKRQSSLKADISSLLQKSIQIRKKKSHFAKMKQTANTPLKEVGFTGRGPIEGGSCTFGVKK
ncbi:unnamed protein product [Moneuplotes crassus]|uniref:Uncharacterized protein n=1 Tax=Euplotes crassus TaxID=5936 RepID=A0AAD1U6J7_EUPCR|nr:unnamed protein product [Moneuplotes crassus]